MTDPRTSTPLRHLLLDRPPSGPFRWAVVAPDPSGRIQLPPAAVDVLGTGPTHARITGDVLVLDHAAVPGRRIGIDRRGRLYLPAWLRRPALVVAVDRVAATVLVTDTAVLDPVGEQLRRAVRS